MTPDRGDVVALTDVSGAPFASYRYDAFGRDLGTLAPGGGTVSAELAGQIASRQPLRYAGYVYDAENALYYLSSRHYDPATFQFLQKDPAKADGEESAYQYCGGDPVGSVDPSGLWRWRAPGINLVVKYCTTWHERRWLYRPGGSRSGMYLIEHKIYNVALTVHKAYMWVIGGSTFSYQYLTADAGHHFKLNSPKRRLAYKRMLRSSRGKVIGLAVVGAYAKYRVMEHLTRNGYLRITKWHVQLRFTYEARVRGRRLGN